MVAKKIRLQFLFVKINLVEKNVLFQHKSFDSKSCPEKLCPKILLVEKNYIGLEYGKNKTGQEL